MMLLSLLHAVLTVFWRRRGITSVRQRFPVMF